MSLKSFGIMRTKEEIRDILTLRYHPRGQTLFPKLGWESFVEYPHTSEMIQPLLEGVIKRIIGEDDGKSVGVGLSGGIDSSTVTSLLRKLYPKLDIKSYCVIFGEDTSDLKSAEVTSELYETDHKTVFVDNPLKNMEDQIKIVGEPRWNLYPYFLFKEATKECDMMLTGDGGDELFGGYVFRYKSILQKSSGSAIQKYLNAHAYDWVPDQQHLFSTGFSWNNIHDMLAANFDNPLPILGQVFLADYNGKLLYDFAPTNAKLSKHFGIKLSAPMLAPEVLYVATHIPYHLKYDAKNEIGKIVLRRILLENFGYKPAMGGKVGWGMSLVEMWDKCARELCVESFVNPLFCKLGIINKDWLPKGFANADKHDLRYINKMLILYALEVYLRLNAVIAR